MAKPRSISGFPEWTPSQKLVEQELIHTITEVYESYGFVPIETPAVELLETLTSKGVVDKELYALKRLHAEDDEESELGLHFDLTVPFARYVALHANEIVFPFKRYQLQKVWRGERPQKGRFREFYQFDIDIVARDNLPLSADAECLSVLNEAVASLSIGPYSIKINNRKLLQGYFDILGLDAEKTQIATRAIDKVDKIGVYGVLKELTASDIDSTTAEKIVTLCKYSFHLADTESEVAKLGVEGELFDKGVSELVDVAKQLSQETLDSIEVQLSLARGLDYYTGLIAETFIDGHRDFGSIASGGRYDGLVSQFSSLKVPGVGFSIGLTRLMDFIFSKGMKEVKKQATAKLLIAVYNEDQRPLCNQKASELRTLGVNTEVFLRSPNLGKQIDYAAKKGIQYVLFLSENEKIELKDITTGEQKEYETLEEITKAISN